MAKDHECQGCPGGVSLEYLEKKFDEVKENAAKDRVAFKTMLQEHMVNDEKIFNGLVDRTNGLHLTLFGDDGRGGVVNDVRLVQNHEVVLHGKDGSSGLVNDMAEIKTGVKVVHWVSSIGGLAGLGSWFKHFFR